MVMMMIMMNDDKVVDYYIDDWHARWECKTVDNDARRIPKSSPRKKCLSES